MHKHSLLQTVLLPFVFAFLAVGLVNAERSSSEGNIETHRYESDISRLRHIVINSLYSQKDIFLRELLSNSNDALEKLRLSMLKNDGGFTGLGGWQGNITIEAIKNEDGSEGGKLIIRDTGIGMSKAELATNLGTIAKSGTSEFLKRASQEGAASDGSGLIGQFGLGFYSTFLVSPRVAVSSLPPPSPSDPSPQPYTFTSSAEGEEFSIFPTESQISWGPCGTEIVLEIEDDDWVLDENKLKDLVSRHSQFSTTFPIYLKDAEGSWIQLNEQGPIWMRDPKDLTDEDYKTFYKTLDPTPGADTLGWAHWRGDSGSGVSFRAMMYIPSKVSDDFWQKAAAGVKNVRLMVKRVFITDDLGEGFLPSWLSFLKVVVDADDLPLNVSRETLQNTRFLRQLKRILVRKALDMFSKIANDDPERYQQFSKVFGHALKVGILDSEEKDRNKLAELIRFTSTRSNFTSLEEYVENRKGSQDQIFFLGGVGESFDSLSRSPFLEVPISRGFEVLLLNAPADESAMQALGTYRGMRLQDVSKQGLKFGDEDEDDEEKEEYEMQTRMYQPLIVWLKRVLEGRVSDVVLTTRLVSSPCAIVSDTYGLSANLQRLMAAQARSDDDAMLRMMMNQPKILEINPKAPLIEGLLDRVLEVYGGDEDEDEELKNEHDIQLQETARVLFETTMVKSGFGIEDKNGFFDRIELLLRRNIGVPITAQGQRSVRPAPPIATGPLPDLDRQTDFSSPYSKGESRPEPTFEKSAPEPKTKPKMGGAGGGLSGDKIIDFSKIKAMMDEGGQLDREKLMEIFADEGSDFTGHDEL